MSTRSGLARSSQSSIAEAFGTIAWTMDDVESGPGSLVVYINVSTPGGLAFITRVGPGLSGTPTVPWSVPAINELNAHIEITAIDPRGLSTLRTGGTFAWLETALGALPDLVRGDVTWDTARIGADLRARTRLPLPDALILASAIEHGAQAIITNDRKWQSRQLPCRVLMLDDYV